MNVTLIRNIGYASVSITIGSSLYVGGILLVSALPHGDRCIIPKQRFGRQIAGLGSTFLYVILFSSFLSLFSSYSVSVPCSLLLFVFVPAGQYFSLCISMFPLFLSLTPVS